MRIYWVIGLDYVWIFGWIADKEVVGIACKGNETKPCGYQRVSLQEFYIYVQNLACPFY